MAYLTTEAVVIRKIKWKESDCLLILYTRERGLVKAIARGARKAGAKLASFLEPFSRIEVMLYQRPGQEIYRVTQARILRGFSGIKGDLSKIGYASFTADLILEMAHGEEPHPALFESLHHCLETIETHRQPDIISLLWVFRLYALLGYQPHLDDCLRCGGAVEEGCAVYSAVNSGVICASCGRGSAGIRLNDPATLRLLRGALQGDLPSQHDAAGTAEIRAVIYESVREHSGRELKSMSFLRKAALAGLLWLAVAMAPSVLPAAGVTGPDSLKIETGARASSMGSAYSAIGDDAFVSWWNPAALIRVTRAQIAFTHGLPFLDTTHDFGAVVLPLGGKAVVELSGLYASVTPFQQIDDLGRETGTVEIYDMVWSGTAAVELADGLAAGGTVKYYLSHLYVYEAKGTAFDLGLLYRVLSTPSPVYLAASVTDLGAPVRYRNESDLLPGRMRIGTGAAVWGEGGSRHLFGVDVEIPFARGENRSVNLGYEWRLIRALFLRAGYRVGMSTGNISLGFGAAVTDWRLDYAYIPYGSLGDTHRVSLVRNFQ